MGFPESRCLWPSRSRQTMGAGNAPGRRPEWLQWSVAHRPHDTGRSQKWSHRGFKTPLLDAHENGPRCAQKSGPTRSPCLARANGPCRRSLGGKRGSGDGPLSRPQPPEAVAEGQSLQGTITRPRSANRRPRWSVSSARMPKGDSPERTRLVGQKNEHTLGPFS